MPSAVVNPFVDVFTSKIGNSFGIRVTEGSGAILEIGVASGLYMIKSLVAGGKNYRTGDRITVPGNELGGIPGGQESDGNDFTYVLNEGDLDLSGAIDFHDTAPAYPTLTALNGIPTREIPLAGGSGFGAKMIHNTPGSGCKLSFAADLTNNYYVRSKITIDEAGSGYQVGNSLYINNGDFAADSPDYDFNCYVMEVDEVGAVLEIGNISGLSNGMSTNSLNTIVNYISYNISTLTETARITSNGGEFALSINLNDQTNQFSINYGGWGYLINTPFVIFGSDIGLTSPSGNLYGKITQLDNKGSVIACVITGFTFQSSLANPLHSNIKTHIQYATGLNITVASGAVTINNPGAGYIPGTILGLTGASTANIGDLSNRIEVLTVDTHGCVLTLGSTSIGDGTYSPFMGSFLYGLPQYPPTIGQNSLITSFESLVYVLPSYNFGETFDGWRSGDVSTTGDDCILIPYTGTASDASMGADYIKNKFEFNGFGNRATNMEPGVYPAYCVGINERGTTTKWKPLPAGTIAPPVLVYVSTNEFSISSNGNRYLISDTVSIRGQLIDNSGDIDFNVMNISAEDAHIAYDRPGNFAYSNLMYLLKSVSQTTSTFSTVDFDPTLISPTVSSSGGQGCTLYVDTSVGVLQYNAVLINGGVGYTNGSTIKVLGNRLGGTTPENDLTCTVTIRSNPTFLNDTGLFYSGYGVDGVVVSISNITGTPPTTILHSHVPITNYSTRGKIIGTSSGSGKAVGDLLAITGGAISNTLEANPPLNAIVKTVSEGVVTSVLSTGAAPSGTRLFTNVVVQYDKIPGNFTLPYIYGLSDPSYNISETLPVQRTSCVLSVGTSNTSFTQGPWIYDVVTVAVGGTGYTVGDQLVIRGSLLGGVDGVNDLTAVVRAINLKGGVTEITNDYPNAYIGGNYGTGVLSGNIVYRQGSIPSYPLAIGIVAQTSGGSGELGSGLVISASVPSNSSTGDYTVSIVDGGKNYKLGDVVSYFPVISYNGQNYVWRNPYQSTLYQYSDQVFIHGTTKVQMTVASVDADGKILTLTNIQGKGITPNIYGFPIPGGMVNLAGYGVPTVQGDPPILFRPVYVGTDLTISVSYTGGSYTIEEIVNGGSGYVEGEVIIIDGTMFGGESILNDLELTIESTKGGAVLSLFPPTLINASDYPLNSTSFVTNDTFNVASTGLTVDLAGTYPLPTITNTGTGYVVGDVITVPGTEWGGQSPANDLTCIVTQTDAGTGGMPITNITNVRGSPYTTYDTIEFKLPVPIKDLVYIEFSRNYGIYWPCLVQIKEIMQSGLTISGVQYWRFVTPNEVNDIPDRLAISKMTPNTYTTFNVRLVDFTGQPLWQETPWSLELVVYSKI